MDACGVNFQHEAVRNDPTVERAGGHTIGRRRGMGHHEIRALIADDDPLARLVLRQTLSAAGIQIVAEAASPAEAIEQAEEHHPDVVLMDAALSENGYVGAMKLLRT